MNLSANDIIKKAMIEARIIYPGESVPESKVALVSDKLDGLLESWSLENLMEVVVFVDRTTKINLANGHARAIISNLALEVGPMFGKGIPRGLLKIAIESKQAIKSYNSHKNKRLRSTPYLTPMTSGGNGSIIDGPY